MTIKTYSGFTYGHTVTDVNKFLNFNEGSGELTATLNVGSYTLGSFVNELATQLNSAGTLDYSVSLDRTNRHITISASANFDLLVSSGTLNGADVFALSGFTGADLTGASSYEGDSASGSFFEPQWLLQSFVPFENNVETTEASINKTASGAVEVVSYGKVRFMECNVALATNIPQGRGSSIKNDPQGETNLRLFLDYATNKAPLEFVPDIDNPNTFTDCLLERTPKSRDGVNYSLRELYSRGFADWYESGLLVFRELI